MPLYMKDAVLTIDGTDVAAECSEVIFSPSSSIATWKGLKPDATHTHASTATWVANIKYGQDWDNEDSLGHLLLASEGESKAAVFRPKTGGQAFYVTIILSPGAIGGAVDGFAESSVSLGMTGKPSLVAPAP